MAKVKKTQSTLESLFFATPEQKILRLFLQNPTTSFSPRVISSKLKGVRGLGGVEGIMKVLHEFESLGLINFLDNHRAVRIRDENECVEILKTLGSVCDLEGLKALLKPISTKGILYGNHAAGKASSDCAYHLFVVSDQSDEVRRIASGYPLERELDVQVWTYDDYTEIDRRDSSLQNRLDTGVVLWDSSW
jgi:hypothetical protein